MWFYWNVSRYLHSLFYYYVFQHLECCLPNSGFIIESSNRLFAEIIGNWWIRMWNNKVRFLVGMFNTMFYSMLGCSVIVEVYLSCIPAELCWLGRPFIHSVNMYWAHTVCQAPRSTEILGSRWSQGDSQTNR